MTRRLVLRRAARAEFDAAVDWYDRRQPGLGAQFATAVKVVLDRIAANPRIHGVVVRDIRKAVVTGFPYCVYYRDRPPAVVVISVFHTSRNPSIWQARK